MGLTVRAQVVDIRADSPKETDVFLVDTNAWLWLYYPRASVALTATQDQYPNYLKQAFVAKFTIHCCSLTFSEFAHNIEKTEREIYAGKAGKPIGPKDFRENYPNQRLKVVTQIKDMWADVSSVSKILDMSLDDAFMQSALTLFPSVGLDGYDLFMAETALKTGVKQVLTDDGDFCTVSGLVVFTANPKVIQAAQAAKRLITR